MIQLTDKSRRAACDKPLRNKGLRLSGVRKSAIGFAPERE
jgi:hypothetical protein